ncbi:hypothetical protein [Streptomyces sp. NBC_00083]|uniref:hypothetical protein n=1 Tax=Streptomyces sp. NBC_00083 TaxID=2975647 RepID=UPI00224D4A94|nr:hypothetical protein [Streptomyces sp. NBC_00083]MCX5386712.1 hypothetical protein [Streptomyces sp. NBC_00083]
MSTAEAKAARGPDHDPAPHRDAVGRGDAPDRRDAVGRDRAARDSAVRADAGVARADTVEESGPEPDDADPGSPGLDHPSSDDIGPRGPGPDDPSSDDAGPDTPDPVAPSPARPRTRILTGLLAAVLLVVGAGLLLQARQLTHAPAVSNRALTDAGATTQVIGDVSNTLGKVFSYVPQDTRATEDAAKDLLGGRAATQYAALFGELKQRVAEQKLTLTTHVVRAGVVRLTRDRAELLVFLDQRAQRDGKPATAAAAQLTVTAQLTHGYWQITDIQAR